MYYDEVIIDGELFYKTDPEGGWIRATNKMLTERLVKLNQDLIDANDTLAEVRQLVEGYTG